MTRLKIAIKENLKTNVREYEHIEEFTYDFENDTAAWLAAAAFAVEKKVTKCITYKLKEDEK